ncbi:MAG TPA: hypothetical protein ENN29_10210 [Candidatus Hydrogenedentes bacterium]|nr:hypothetical protein [Candidatus Hydrogenedentota bacterium]
MDTQKKEKPRRNDPRQIVRWTRRYAQNRTISFLVQWVFIVLMVIIIGLAASLTQLAHKRESQALFTLSVAMMVLSMLALAWFSLSRWSGHLISSITNRLYGREGYVAYSGIHKQEKLPLWLTALGGGLVVYHLVGALLISFNYMHIQYLQPWSALYMTPYLIAMVLYQRLGFWAWLWPLLYGLHALLMLYGAPVRFGREYELLNIIVPIFGYGLFAIIAGHIYSRYALWKLKTLTRDAIPDIDGDDDAAPGETSEEAGHG